jgi:hypothetical protein
MIHDTHDPEPRYRHFRITYRSGTVLDSYWCIEGGGTLRAVRMEHPSAAVEAVEESRVSLEADRT